MTIMTKATVRGKIFNKKSKKNKSLTKDNVLANAEHNIPLTKDNVLAGAEHIYIDVVMPLFENDISLYDIQYLLDKNQLNALTDLYNVITHRNKINYSNQHLNISKLLKSNLFTPIVDDFILFHKNAEKYDSEKLKKIQYIINKIDIVSNFFSAKNDVNELSKTNQIMYVNHLENVNIINKLINIHLTTQTSLYNDFVDFQQNALFPYGNFKTLLNDYFTFNEEKNINLVRKVSLKSDNFHYRPNGFDTEINIIGLILNFLPKGNKNNILDNYLSKRIKKHLTLDSEENNYPKIVEQIKQQIKSHIFNKKNNNDAIIWLFDIKKDKPDYSANNELTENETTDSIMKNMINTLFEDVLKIMYKTILEIINSYKKITIERCFKIIEFVEKEIIGIKFPEEYIEKIKFSIYYEKTKKQISFQNKKKDHHSNYNIEIKEITDEKVNAICHHEYIFKNMSNQEQQKFLSTFCVLNENNAYMCKSCDKIVESGSFLTEGSYTDEGGYIESGITVKIKIEEIAKYEKYNKIIKYIDVVIKNVCDATNFKYYLTATQNTENQNNESMTERRQTIIQKIIDIFVEEKFKKQFEKEKKIQLSDLVFFNLDSEIYDKTNNDTLLMRNNILIHIVCILIFEINEYQIANLSENKVCNKKVFETYGKKLFNDLNIIVNSSGDTMPILNYPILCYIIFNFACKLSSNKIWIETAEKQNVAFTTKKIIHTVANCINFVIGIKQINNETISIISLLFFSKLKNLYKNEKQVIENKHRHANISIIQENPKKILFKYFPPVKTNSYEKNFVISELTNCLDGNFHVWKVNKCENCGVVFNLKLKNDDNKNILWKYLSKSSKNLFGNKKYNYDENEIKKQFEKPNIKIVKEKDVTVEKKSTNLDSLVDKFNKDKFADFSKFLTKHIYETIGEKVNNIHITHDIFTIDHEKNGLSLKKPVSFTSVKYEYSEEHKMHVIIISVSGNEMFYSTDTLFYLGFKDDNKKFIKNVVKSAYLKCSHSLKYMIKYLGYSFNEITKIKCELSETNDENNDVKKIFDQEYKNRFENLKKTIFGIKKILNKIVTKTFDQYDIGGEMFKKYEKLIGDLQNDNFLKDIELIFDSIIYDTAIYDEDLNEEKIKSKNLRNAKLRSMVSEKDKLKNKELKNNMEIHSQIEIITKYDDINNMLTYYLMDEINKFIIKNNDNKINLLNLFVDMIKYFFDNFNIFEQMKNIDVARFYNTMNFTYIDKEFVKDAKLKDPSALTKQDIADQDEIFGLMNDENSDEQNINNENEDDAIDYGTEDNLGSMYNIAN